MVRQREAEDARPRTRKRRKRNPAINRHLRLCSCLLACLLLGGLLVGLMSALTPTSIEAADRFENRTACAAHLLDGPHIVSVTAAPPVPAEAGMALFGCIRRNCDCRRQSAEQAHPRIRGKVVKPLEMVQRIHSGHVGDYVMFLTAGHGLLGLCVRTVLADAGVVGVVELSKRWITFWTGYVGSVAAKGMAAASGICIE